MPVAELTFPVASLHALESAFAAVEKVSGTNVKELVCAFDDTTEEYRNGSFHVPQDIDGSGTVTFRAYVRAKTAAASKNVALTFGHYAANDSEAYDAAYTEEDSGDKAIDATQGDWTEITWTETVSNLGWAAGDLVTFRISRYDAPTNDLSGDMYWRTFAVEIPLA